VGAASVHQSARGGMLGNGLINAARGAPPRLVLHVSVPDARAPARGACVGHGGRDAAKAQAYRNPAGLGDSPVGPLGSEIVLAAQGFGSSSVRATRAGDVALLDSAESAPSCLMRTPMPRRMGEGAGGGQHCKGVERGGDLRSKCAKTRSTGRGTCARIQR
jgi:hypothetical protein